MGDAYLYLFCLLFVIGVVLYLIINVFSKRAKVLKEVKSVDLSSIASVKDDSIIKLIGEVKPDTSFLNAPITRRPCVYYKVLVMIGAEHLGQKTVLEKEDIQDFQIDLGYDYAKIKAKDQLDTTIIEVKEDRVFNTREPNINNTSAIDYLKTHKQSFKFWWGETKLFTIYEYIIAPEDTIAVVGIGQRKKTAKKSEEGFGSGILEVSGTPNQKLVLTTDKHALNY